MDIICPWCGEGGYDLFGLKEHLQGTVFWSGCEKFIECDEAATKGEV